MSKVHEILEKIKRHQFWILCGIIALVGMISWWLATGSLASTFQQNKSKIESAAKTIADVESQTPHPNPRWKEALEAQLKIQQDRVFSAWQELYAKQKKDVYVWPTDIFGPDFVEHVTSLRPGEPMDVSYLDRFQSYVKQEFKRLASIVDAEWQDPTAVTSPYAQKEAQRPSAKNAHKVVWNGQDMLQKPYMFPERPTTLQVMYAQEEIWVMEAICRAIAEANAGAAGSHDATVRIIEQLSVGYLAAEEAPGGMGANRIIRVKAAVVSADGGGGEMLGAPVTADGASAGPLQRPPHPYIQTQGYGARGYAAMSREASAAAADTGGGGGGSGDFDEGIKAWRYVNDKLKPLEAAELANPPFQEFRLMPWRLRVVADQSKWDRLIVACRNTTLPLAIRQVRINAAEDLALSRTGGRALEGAGTGYTDSLDGPGYGQVRAELEGGTPTVTLELRGVAYLVNEPDRSKVGQGGGSGAGDGSAADEGGTVAAAAGNEAAAPVAAAAADGTVGAAGTPAATAPSNQNGAAAPPAASVPPAASGAEPGGNAAEGSANPVPAPPPPAGPPVQQ